MCREVGIDTDVLVLANCPVLPVARNTLVAMFLADPEATDLFFVDYDVKFNAEAVIKLLKRPEPIVAGAYRVKTDDRISWAVEIQTSDGVPRGKVDGDEVLVRADFMATGFMRIKRGVFSKLQTAYPELKYRENVIKTENRKIDEAYDYFAMGVDSVRGRYTTEDFAFCQRWRDIGGELWVYPNIDFDHVGKKAYTGNYHEYLLTLPGSGVARAAEVPGWMTLKELCWLSQQAMKRNSIVEVGSWMGRSTTALAASTLGVVYAVDTWEGTPAEHSEIMKALTPKNLFKAFQHHTAGLSNVVPIRKQSIEAAAEFNNVDMVFIDANHDYENARADILAWRDRLNDGGLLCGHDYEYSEGVKRAVSELLPGAVVVPGTDIWAWNKAA